MFKLYTLLIALTSIVVTSVNAETMRIKSGEFRTPVVELYTSEGCSSCPPADEWLNQLTKIPKQDLDVLALAFHVDYWDYIGWKDEFASPQYTNRQRILARQNRQSTIYTPEFFVDGNESRGTLSVIENIRKANKTRSTVDLELILDKKPGGLQLNLVSNPNSEQDLVVQFVIFEDNLSNQIERGENAGRELHHQRVVRYLSPEIDLTQNLAHSIKLEPEWGTQNLGIAALVKTDSNRYLQSVHSKL